MLVLQERATDARPDVPEPPALRRPGSTTRPLLSATKLALVTLVIITLVTAAMIGGKPEARDVAIETTRVAPGAALSHTLERYDCRIGTWDAAANPAAALIRLRGHVLHVSFERGFATYAGRQPGRFIAMCAK